MNVDLVQTFTWLIGLSFKRIATPQTFSAALHRDKEKRLPIRWPQDVIVPTPNIKNVIKLFLFSAAGKTALGDSR